MSTFYLYVLDECERLVQVDEVEALDERHAERLFIPRNPITMLKNEYRVVSHADVLDVLWGCDQGVLACA